MGSPYVSWIRRKYENMDANPRPRRYYDVLEHKSQRNDFSLVGEYISGSDSRHNPPVHRAGTTSGMAAAFLKEKLFLIIEEVLQVVDNNNHSGGQLRLHCLPCTGSKLRPDGLNYKPNLRDGPTNTVNKVDRDSFRFRDPTSQRHKLPKRLLNSHLAPQLDRTGLPGLLTI